MKSDNHPNKRFPSKNSNLKERLENIITLFSHVIQTRANEYKGVAESDTVPAISSPGSYYSCADGISGTPVQYDNFIGYMGLPVYADSSCTLVKSAFGDYWEVHRYVVGSSTVLLSYNPSVLEDVTDEDNWQQDLQASDTGQYTGDTSELNKWGIYIDSVGGNKYEFVPDGSTGEFILVRHKINNVYQTGS